MQNTKSLLVLLVLGLILSATMSGAGQLDDFLYTESGNSITITDYAGSGKEVVIPDTIGGKAVTAIGFLAFFNCTELTSLTIPDSIARIDAQAFSGCTGLASLYIPESVTSIGAEAFSYCSALTSLTIPVSVISIGPEAFSNCAGLVDIEVEAGNTAYSSVNGVLFNKARTKLVQYPGGRAGTFIIPDSVTHIEGAAFFACSGLTGISIPASVKTIEDYAFCGSTGLTAAYFYGNAPLMGEEVFKNCANGFMVCYAPGSTGFTNPWYGFTTADCSPPIDDGGVLVTTTTSTTVLITTTTTTTIITEKLCPAQKVLGLHNPTLENLRTLRDGILAKNAVGQGITKSYYNNAPWLNKALDRSPALRAIARKFFEVSAFLVENKK